MNLEWEHRLCCFYFYIGLSQTQMRNFEWEIEIKKHDFIFFLDYKFYVYFQKNINYVTWNLHIRWASAGSWPCIKEDRLVCQTGPCCGEQPHRWNCFLLRVCLTWQEPPRGRWQRSWARDGGPDARAAGKTMTSNTVSVIAAILFSCEAALLRVAMATSVRRPALWVGAVFGSVLHSHWSWISKEENVQTSCKLFPSADLKL